MRIRLHGGKRRIGFIGRNDADQAAFAGAEKRVESKEFTGCADFILHGDGRFVQQNAHFRFGSDFIQCCPQAAAGGVTQHMHIGAAATIASTMRPSGAQSETSVVPKVMPSRRLITVMP